MDDRGFIHVIEEDHGEGAAQKMRDLEEKFGKLVEVPREDLQEVVNMNRAQRRAWYRRQRRAGAG